MPCGSGLPLDKLFHQIAARTDLHLHSRSHIARLPSVARRLVDLLTCLSTGPTGDARAVDPLPRNGEMLALLGTSGANCPIGRSVGLISSCASSVGLTDTSDGDGRTGCVISRVDWMCRQELPLTMRCWILRTFLLRAEDTLGSCLPKSAALEPCP
jgi:hypothetical protein